VVGWTRRLQCPKCGRTFDYEFVPGASFTAVRLGTARYLRCPLCGKFSVFPLTGPAPPTSPGRPEGNAPPKYSDVPSATRGVALMIVPFTAFLLLAVFLLPRPEPALGIALLGGAIFASVAALLVYRSRLTRKSPG
jgi:hypothetical protein